MGWRIWITWLILFSFLYSRLFWIHQQKTRNILQMAHQSKYLLTNLKKELHLKLNKSGYYLELLTPETSTLLGSNKNR